MADPPRGMMIATVRMIGFSGHVEISQDSVPLIHRALRDRLGTMHGPFVGITMMGPGADQVFARVVLETGGHLYVVMPTLGFQYRDEFEDPGARAIYDQLFARATYVARVANYRWSTIESHLDGGRAVVDACHVLYAVWDGRPGFLTGEVVQYARDVGKPVVRIWPQGATRVV
jgi:hypothetical protein